MGPLRTQQRCFAWGMLCLGLLGCGRSQPSAPIVVETTEAEVEEAWPPQQTFAIKFKEHPELGKRIIIRQTQKESGVNRVLDMSGKLLREEDPAQTRETVALLSALEQGASGPRKLSLSIQKDALTQAKIAKPGPTLGRTIVLEQLDNRWTASVATGSPLPREVLDALALDVQTRLAPILVPGKPVRIGERWPIRESLLLDRFAALGAVGPAGGEALLVRVQRKEGRQQGRIEFSLTLAVRDSRMPRMQDPYTLNVSGQLETAIDGSSTAATLNTTVKTAGTFLWDKGGVKLQVKTNTETVTTEERSEEK
jgi:hypothetical protein